MHMSKHTVGSSPWPNCSSVFSAGESRAAEWTLYYSPGNRIEALAVLPLTWGSRCCLGSSRKAEQKGRTLGLGPVLVIQVRGTSLSLDEPTCQCRRHKRRGFHPWSREDPREKEMATHSTILAWRIPRTEKPGRLQAVVSQESDMSKVT